MLRLLWWSVLLVYVSSPIMGSAQTAVSNPDQLDNAFKIDFDKNSIRLQEMAKSEDLASPFTDAHYAEQERYISLYQTMHVWHNPYPEGSEARKHSADPNPPNIKLPPPNDKNGRPLWFDGMHGFEALKRIVTGLYYAQFYDNLDKIFIEWSKSSERIADGRWKLSAFQFPVPAYSSTTEWEEAYKRIQQWREKSPRSAAAAIFEIQYWYDYAYDARGRGYARTVQNDGWALFRERMARAKAILVESKPYAGDNPLWGEFWIEVIANSDASKEDLKDGFREAIKLNPEYMRDYFLVAHYLTPRWGGDWASVETFARDALEKTKAADGYAMYARLYWVVSEGEASTNANVFEYTTASWPDIKRGFNDIMRQYPHSGFNLNRFAAFACMAGDKETFQSIRSLIGKSIVPSQWWSPGYSLSLCEQRFSSTAQ